MGSQRSIKTLPPVNGYADAGPKGSIFLRQTRKSASEFVVRRGNSWSRKLELGSCYSLDEGRSALTASASVSRPSNLDSTASKSLQASNFSLKSGSLASAEKPTIFTWGNFLRRVDAVSAPFGFGIFKSRTTNSQWFASAVWTADKPSPASSHRYGVLVSKKFRMAPRTAALSSTTRIQGLRSGARRFTVTYALLGLCLHGEQPSQPLFLTSSLWEYT